MHHGCTGQVPASTLSFSHVQVINLNNCIINKGNLKDYFLKIMGESRITRDTFLRLSNISAHNTGQHDFWRQKTKTRFIANLM